MNGTNIIAGFCAFLMAMLLFAMTLTAFDKEAENDAAKTAKHVGQMDADTRRVVGGGR